MTGSVGDGRSLANELLNPNCSHSLTAPRQSGSDFLNGCDGASMMVSYDNCTASLSLFPEMPLRPAVTFAVGDIPRKVLDVIGTIAKIRFPAQGQVSDLACVETTRGSFALKRIREKIAFLDGFEGGVRPQLDWAEREYRVLSILAPLGLPVAQPHGCFRLGTPPNEEAWLVMDALPGEPLYSGEDTTAAQEDCTRRILTPPWGPAVMRSLGRALAKVHQVPLTPELAGPNGDIMDGRIALVEGWVKEDEQAKDEFWATEHRSQLNRLLGLKAHPPSHVLPTLIHGDLNHANVLAVGAEVSGIVDWTGARAGDPRHDIASVLKFRRVADFRFDAPVLAFFEGYGIPPLPREEILWFLKATLW